jgi:hypothetical protein
MGRLFIQRYENVNYTFSCKSCKFHFAHTDHIVIRQIETMYGECFGFVESINLYETHNDNWSTYTYHGEFDMYDDNSILKNETSQSYFLHCIKCNLFVGWKYMEPNTEKHILLKSRVL